MIVLNLKINRNQHKTERKPLCQNVIKKGLRRSAGFNSPPPKRNSSIRVPMNTRRLHVETRNQKFGFANTNTLIRLFRATDWVEQTQNIN